MSSFDQYIYTTGGRTPLESIAIRSTEWADILYFSVICIISICGIFAYQKTTPEYNIIFSVVFVGSLIFGLVLFNNAPYAEGNIYGYVDKFEAIDKSLYGLIQSIKGLIYILLGGIGLVNSYKIFISSKEKINLQR